jgi:hypothetical protein
MPKNLLGTLLNADSDSGGSDMLLGDVSAVGLDHVDRRAPGHTARFRPSQHLTYPSVCGHFSVQPHWVLVKCLANLLTSDLTGPGGQPPVPTGNWLASSLSIFSLSLFFTLSPFQLPALLS